ncbi:MAG: hypothetical protein Q9O74_09580 [Planctomycetota bacterium]|nr:hypothetical protein [Planctomycetota bacterium]
MKKQRTNFSEISKFKRVEASLRESVNSLAGTLSEIDTALAGPRTEEERALLCAARDQIEVLRANGQTVLHRLWAEVEG